jgi:hypothetical protein
VGNVLVRSRPARSAGTKKTWRQAKAERRFVERKLDGFLVAEGTLASFESSSVRAAGGRRALAGSGIALPCSSGGKARACDEGAWFDVELAIAPCARWLDRRTGQMPRATGVLLPARVERKLGQGPKPWQRRGDGHS